MQDKDTVHLETLIKQNSMHEKINKVRSSLTASYHSIQNILYFFLLPKNTNIKIYIIIIFVCCFIWAENLLFPSKKIV